MSIVLNACNEVVNMNIDDIVTNPKHIIKTLNMYQVFMDNLIDNKQNFGIALDKYRHYLMSGMKNMSLQQFDKYNKILNKYELKYIDLYSNKK